MRKLNGIIALILVLTLGAYVYSSSFPPRARATKAAEQFMRAAALGDQATVLHMLAPDSAALTTPQLLKEYKGRAARSFHASRATSNRSGVEMVILVGLATPDGYTKTTLLAMKRFGGDWVIMKAGNELSY